MDRSTAQQIVTDAMPETGVVAWEDVFNTLQATPEGRTATKQFHAMRRDPDTAIFAKYDRKAKTLLVSREPFPTENE